MNKYFSTKLIKLALIYSLFISNICYAQYTKIFDFDISIGTVPIADLLYDGNYLYGVYRGGRN